MSAHTTHANTSSSKPSPPPKPAPTIPPYLYHTTLTSINSNPSTQGTTLTTYVLGTHTNLSAAHPFSLSALNRLGYHSSDFSAYHTKPDPDTPSPGWKYGPSVTVYTAPLPNKDSPDASPPPQFIIGIARTPNTLSLAENTADHTVLLPRTSSPSPRQLYYVLQTKTDYRNIGDGSEPPPPVGQDGYQTVDVEGCYPSRGDALKAAKGVLKGMEGRTQFDEQGKGEGYWPFGEDTVVHAVGDMGEMYAVSVRTAREGVERFAKPGK